MKKLKRKNKYLIEIDGPKIDTVEMLKYRRELFLIKKDMAKEYDSTIIDIYKNNLYLLVSNPTYYIEKLQNAINMLGEKYFLKYSFNSFSLANNFIKNIESNNYKRFERLEKKHEFLKTSPFLLKNTKDRENTLRIVEASVAENVGLIKSIPKEYHDDILGDVMRTVGKGGNLQELTEALSKRSNITSGRIDLIARDQTAKATALLDQQHAKDFGFRRGFWKKSIAGKTHRASHAEADGKEFDLEKGCFIDGKYILPKMEINCKCSYRLVM